MIRRTDAICPTSLIMLVSILDKRRPVGPSAGIDCVDAYLGVNPRLGPRNWTAFFIFMLMYVEMMLTQRKPFLKVARFREGVMPCSLRYRFRITSTIFGKNRASPEVLCTTPSPRTAFFCVVNYNLP